MDINEHISVWHPSMFNEKQHHTVSISISKAPTKKSKKKLRLTDADGGQEPGGDVWRQAVWERRLQDVVGEGERDDGQSGGIHDEDGAP